MKIVITGGSGQIGRLLVRAWAARGFECVVIVRHAEAVSGASRVVAWDGRTVGSWAAELEGADVVANLAGRSVDCRYTEGNLEQMRASRVDSARVVGTAIARCERPPRVWLQMSTATIYAHRFDVANDEQTGLIGGREPGVPALWRRSVEIAQAWEAEVANAVTPQTRKIILRSAMVMSPDRGGVFDVLAMLGALGVGRHGNGRQFVSWIHERDFVRAVDFLIAHEELSGAFNLASPGPLPNRDFVVGLRAALGRRWAVPLPRWMLEIGAFVRRTESELLLKSRRVVPGRLLDAGFRFEFERWEDAARDLVARRSIAEKRWRRVLLELFGPPALGAMVFWLFAVGGSVSDWFEGRRALRPVELAQAWLLLTLFAYFFAGLQSIIYTVVLEWRFSRGLDPASWLTVAWSTVLGWLSGAAIVVVLGPSQADGIAWLVWSGLGAIVGFVNGTLIRRLSRRAATPTAPCADTKQ